MTVESMTFSVSSPWSMCPAVQAGRTQASLEPYFPGVEPAHPILREFLSVLVFTLKHYAHPKR